VRGEYAFSILLSLSLEVTFMKVSYLLLISLIIVGALFVPAVSAEEILIDSDSFTKTFTVPKVSGGNRGIDSIGVYRIENYKGLKFVYVNCPHVVSTSIVQDSPSYSKEVTLKVGGTTVGHGTAGYNGMFNSQGNVIGCQFYVEIDDFNPGTLTGTRKIELIPDSGTLFNGIIVGTSYATGSRNNRINETFDIALSSTYQMAYGEIYQYPTPGSVIIRNDYYWENRINIDNSNLELIRNLDGNAYFSELSITSNSGTVNDNSAHDITVPFVGTLNWSVTSPYGKIFTGSSESDDPGETPTMRTGSVTMTDHNGTTITGFEVTAVNHYTGEEYNVSTDTDVAVITLPMDRTIEIRNPQTGVYETAPVGYYRFFGQAPGYKMLNEDGIKVSVMPEKYGSYQLCDILVTSESGYLTGKHQFQIRSRSDNSILQTGTVSAKSATTGEWYNTTVSGGLATLILPYDTSNTKSQYAGNYYVYATSPGYEDSDYGTQIVVMPHTVSEINTILLTPIGGIPAAGNVTLRIQAFSETGPGIPNAEIFIAGVLGAGKDVWETYTASSTGYLTVSVPGNSTYDIVASGAGYYDSARRIEVFTEPPGLIEIKLYSSGAPTVEPTTQPTGWPTTQPTTTPTGGIPDEDDDSEGFLIQAVRGIGLAFGVGFATAKLILGMLLALSIGYATAKQLRGGAAEFGVGLLGGTLLGVLIGLLPVWIIVVLLLVVGLYIGNRYVGGANNG